MHCKHLNCTSRDRVNATTDIAGSGVIAAFLASALLTILAILYAYISDSLPEWYLNETDKTVISSIQQWLPTRRTRQHMRLMWFKIKCFFFRPFGLEPSQPARPLNRAERQELVTRFILSLSDQQLATGIAILIAAIANQCELSVYEFQVAFSLAWFSSTTHLATLDCLQDYFRKHGVVRNWRVVGMICLLALIAYTLLMTMASIDETIPVACTFQYFGEDAVDGHDPISVYLILSAAFTLAFLAWNYGVRILWSYRRNDGRSGFVENVVFNARTKHLRKTLKPSKMEYKYIRKEAILEMRARRKRAELERIKGTTNIRHHLLVLLRASRLYRESFLSSGPLLVFMAAYGFTQLYVNRWHADVPVSIDQSMSFGQITPLFLLILPFLAAGEIYYEVKDNDHVDTLASENKDTSIETRDYSAVSQALDAALKPVSLPLSAGADDRYLEPARKMYDDLLSDIKKFYHVELKDVFRQESFAATDKDYNAVLRAKCMLLSQFRTFRALETALAPTMLTSLPEFLVACCAGLALGILLNSEDPNPGTTITGIVLLVCYAAYGIAGLLGHVYDSWQTLSIEEYRELLDEAKTAITNERAKVSNPELPRRTSTTSFRTATSRPIASIEQELKMTEMGPCSQG